MSLSATHDQVVRNPGKLTVAANTRNLFLGFIAIGIISFFVLYRMNSDRAWSTFIINHWFFFSLSLGGIVFAAIQWATGAMWSAPIRRIAESFTAYLPIAFGTFCILWVFGVHYDAIYPWADAQTVTGDMVLEGRSGFMNSNFFFLRNLLFFGIWFVMTKKMIGNSLSQDANGDYSYTLANRKWSAAFIILFALTYTFAAWDQLMSLAPKWFSTIFGVYCFGGMLYSIFALLAILTIQFRRRGILTGIVNDNHLHDIGKFMFAFIVFWAYIAFSQFMLIWYANLPEETGYYIRRMDQGWMAVSTFLLVGKFVVPFFLMLPRGAKRNETRLLSVAWFMLIAQWIDLLWVVQPEFFTDRPYLGLFDLGLTLGFVGMFGFMVTQFLSKNNIVAMGDPRLAESVFHHHQ